MKADEYVEMFLKAEKEVSGEAALTQIVVAMAKEVEHISSKRQVQSMSGLASIVKEMNEKWFAINKRLKKRKGIDVLKPDGFSRVILMKIPQLAKWGV